MGPPEELPPPPPLQGIEGPIPTQPVVAVNTQSLDDYVTTEGKGRYKGYAVALSDEEVKALRKLLSGAVARQLEAERAKVLESE